MADRTPARGKLQLALPIAAALALMLPSEAGASHSWNGFHWSNPSATASRALTISDRVSGDWDSVFGDVLSGWNASLGGRLTLVLGSGKTSITTSSGSFGNNGWLGLAQVWLKGGHISRAVVKLNDFYFDLDPTIDTPQARQQVFCQEAGHALGLDHQYADSCMNDLNDLASSPFPYPNTHDGEQLASIYAHADAGGSKGAHERGPFTVSVFPAPGY